jgi:hypothetical protein
MVIFTRHVPERVKVSRLVVELTAHCRRDFADGTTTVLVIPERSIKSALMSAVVVLELLALNTGVVNVRVSPTVVPAALVAAIRQ